MRRLGETGAADSDHLALADGHVDFLAGLGDFLAQALVLALELAGVHAEHLAQEGAVAGVGLALELFERLFDLIGQVEQELGLSLDVGQRSLELDGGDRARPACEPIGRFGRASRNRRRRASPVALSGPVS